jgi:hypothetical protein
MKDVKADQQWQAIVGRQRDRERVGKADFIAAPLMRDVGTDRSTVLNRLSHSGTPPLVTSEVKFAFDTIKHHRQDQLTKI